MSREVEDISYFLLKILIWWYVHYVQIPKLVMLSEFGIVSTNKYQCFSYIIHYQHKKEFCNLFKTCGVAGMVRFMRLQYARHVCMIEKKGTHLKVFIWKTGNRAKILKSILQRHCTAGLCVTVTFGICCVSYLDCTATVLMRTNVLYQWYKFHCFIPCVIWVTEFT
jgi:hypothetical protein